MTSKIAVPTDNRATFPTRSANFRTTHGRLVRDGGGITPDIVVEEDSLPDLIAYLEASEQLFDFVTDYCNTRKKIAAPTEFHLSDQRFRSLQAIYGQKRFHLRQSHAPITRSREAMGQV